MYICWHKFDTVWKSLTECGCCSGMFRSLCWIGFHHQKFSEMCHTYWFNYLRCFINTWSKMIKNGNTFSYQAGCFVALQSAVEPEWGLPLASRARPCGMRVTPTIELVWRLRGWRSRCGMPACPQRLEAVLNLSQDKPSKLIQNMGLSSPKYHISSQSDEPMLWFLDVYHLISSPKPREPPIHTCSWPRMEQNPIGQPLHRRHEDLEWWWSAD